MTTVDFGPATGRRPFAPEAPAKVPDEDAEAGTPPRGSIGIPKPDAKPVERSEPVPQRLASAAAPRPTKSQGIGLTRPIILALLAVVAIVGAALFFQSRPASDPAAVAPDAEVEVPVLETTAFAGTPIEAAPSLPQTGARATGQTPVTALVAAARPAPDSVALDAQVRPDTPAPQVPEAAASAPVVAPEPVNELSPPGTPRPSVVRPMPRPAATRAASGVPVAAETATVVIRVGPGMDAERQALIVAALNQAGYGSVEVQPVTFNVARSRLGFFRNEDRQLAEALAALIAPLAGEVAVRNYDQLLVEPAPGRLDLWLRS